MKTVQDLINASPANIDRWRSEATSFYNLSLKHTDAEKLKDLKSSIDICRVNIKVLWQVLMDECPYESKLVGRAYDAFTTCQAYTDTIAQRIDMIAQRTAK
jgi:hypothetical protein